MMTEKMADRASFAQWFGQYSSSPKYADRDKTPEEAQAAEMSIEEVQDLLTTGAELIRNPASRFTFIRHSPNSSTLFVDGEDFICGQSSIAFAERLTAYDPIVADAGILKIEAVLTLITLLINQGSLILEMSE